MTHIYDARKILVRIGKKRKIQKLTRSLHKSGGNGVDKLSAASEEEESEFEESKAPPVTRSRGVLKSRNAVINDWLSTEGYDDNYADLEDFIDESM
jgi:hypothetical protein